MSKETEQRRQLVLEIATDLLNLFEMDPGEVTGIHIQATPFRVTFDRRVTTDDGRTYVVATLADGTQV